MTIQTLGRKAFEAFWQSRALAGERSANKIAETGWENTAPIIKQAWEKTARFISDFTVEMLPPQLLERTPRAPRQGGMVNVHTQPPAHYNAHPSGVECIEITRHLPFNLGNVVKYIWRAGLKENESEIKDLEKSLDYLNDEINKRKLALQNSTPRHRDESIWDARASLSEQRAEAKAAEQREAIARSRHCSRAWGYRWEPVLDARVKDHTPGYGPDGKGHQ